eukprot:4866781-Lingulodinium_polyedra.AAC.1
MEDCFTPTLDGVERTCAAAAKRLGSTRSAKAALAAAASVTPDGRVCPLCQAADTAADIVLPSQHFRWGMPPRAGKNDGK